MSDKNPKTKNVTVYVGKKGNIERIKKNKDPTLKKFSEYCGLSPSENQGNGESEKYWAKLKEEEPALFTDLKVLLIDSFKSKNSENSKYGEFASVLKKKELTAGELANIVAEHYENEIKQLNEDYQNNSTHSQTGMDERISSVFADSEEVQNQDSTSTEGIDARLQQQAERQDAENLSVFDELPVEIEQTIQDQESSTETTGYENNQRSEATENSFESESEYIDAPQDHSQTKGNSVDSVFSGDMLGSQMGGADSTTSLDNNSNTDPTKEKQDAGKGESKMDEYTSRKGKQNYDYKQSSSNQERNTLEKEINKQVNDVMEKTIAVFTYNTMLFKNELHTHNKLQSQIKDNKWRYLVGGLIGAAIVTASLFGIDYYQLSNKTKELSNQTTTLKSKVTKLTDTNLKLQSKNNELDSSANKYTTARKVFMAQYLENCGILKEKDDAFTTDFVIPGKNIPQSYKDKKSTIDKLVNEVKEAEVDSTTMTKWSLNQLADKSSGCSNLVAMYPEWNTLALEQITPEQSKLPPSSRSNKNSRKPQRRVRQQKGTANPKQQKVGTNPKQQKAEKNLNIELF